MTVFSSQVVVMAVQALLAYNHWGPPALHQASSQVTLKLTTSEFPMQSAATSHADIQATALAALAEWQQASGVTLVLQSSANRNAASRNGENLISWGTASEWGMARGSVPYAWCSCYSSGSGAASECDIAVFWEDGTTGLPVSQQFTTRDEDGLMDLKALLLHEWGHGMGLDHSSLGNAIMWPFLRVVRWGDWSSSLAHLTHDEKAGLVNSYPGSVLAQGTGSIAGQVTKSGSAVLGARVIAHRRSDGIAYGENITTTAGTYSIKGLPPGQYDVHAQPVSGPTTSAANFQLGSWRAGAFTTGWQTTVLGGAATPTAVNVTAGGVTAVPTIAVTLGADVVTTSWLARDDRATIMGTCIPVRPGESLELNVNQEGSGFASVTSWSTTDPGIVVGTPDVYDTRVYLPLTVAPGLRGGARSLVMTIGSRKEFVAGMLLVPTELLCGDGTDDDSDGSVDCADTDCDEYGPCVGSPDADGDGVADSSDNCDAFSNPNQADADSDMAGDACDNCLILANATQGDADGDGTGDACEFAWGDLAPAGTPNGMVDVADVVRALRFAVSLEIPSATDMARGNVAPASRVSAGPPEVMQPLGTPAVLDVADVVLVLRAAVNLTDFPAPR